MNTSDPYHFSTFKTPLGSFSVAVDSKGGVAAAAFGGRKSLGLRLHSDRLIMDPAGTAPARRQVEEWFRGERKAFTLALAPAGTSFQRKVWSALSRIPYGATRSYGDLSKKVGGSPRAVGRANATNPICLLIPCHRVIGADGSLTGYAFGEARKRKLLRHEAG
jgi:methylated-DNA-[protein]-cysteine S-methyltransferase